MIRWRQISCGAALALLTACAPARPALPAGTGTPLPGFEAVYDEAVRDCRGVRTAVAELGLSGRAGSTRLRGRINAGLAEPSAIRLEGIALGRPIFILAGRDGAATLLLPRDERVVRGAPESIVEALAGVAVTPADLRAAVAGCGLVTGAPTNGRAFGNDWAAVDVGDTVTFLRRIAGRWRVAAAVRPPLTIRYDELSTGPPATILMRSQMPGSAEAAADITLRVSQLELNVPIDHKAFEINVPPGADPLTVDELRRAGPLGERRD